MKRISVSLLCVVVLTASAFGSVGRLVNASALVHLSGRVADVALGYSTNGTVLVRTIGPELGAFGISDPLPRTAVAIYEFSPQLRFEASRGAWFVPLDPMSTGVAQFQDRPGVFPLARSSQSSALLSFAGLHTAIVNSPSGAAGTGLIELYAGDALVTNVSLRTPMPFEASSQGLAFVIDGDTAATVLVRAIGAGMKPFGVRDRAAISSLSVYHPEGSTQRLVARTFHDATDESAIAAAASVGAFPQSPADCGVLVRLDPGIYSAVSEIATPGDALIEVYVLP